MAPLASPETSTVTPLVLSPWRLAQSPLGKKLLTGITGLLLAGFVLIHLLGNLLLLSSTTAFNLYGAWLESAKPILWSVEGLLLLAIAIHAFLGIQIYLSKKNARPIAYESYKSVNQVRDPGEDTSAKALSFQTLSSRTMIWTGLTLAAFILWHLVTFKFGPRYEIELEGRTVRDLARLVIETFQQPFYTFSYVAVMGMLGFHLRHGFWSALQSLGLLNRGIRAWVFGLSGLVAVAIALGFMVLPLAIYGGWLG